MALVTQRVLEEQVIGSQSPVQQALGLVEGFVRDMPEPDVGEKARPAAQLIANHLLHLFRGAGLLNVLGHHSPVVGLLRQMHDALDCFLAVCLLPGAAVRWEKDDLKASEAATMADQHFASRQVRDASGDTMSWGEYRKTLRHLSNAIAHCSPQLTHYNVGLVPVAHEAGEYRIELVLPGGGSDLNCHQLDAFLTASLGEMAEAILESFGTHLAGNPHLRMELENGVGALRKIMEQHNAHRCHEMTGPAELKGLQS